MDKSIYDLAHNLTGKYFNDGMMSVMGAKVVDNCMYVKGGDNSFPRTRAHVKVDLTTNEIVEHYGACNCPVLVTEGIYE